MANIISVFFLIIISFNTILGATLTKTKCIKTTWAKNQTFLQYLQKEGIDKNNYYNLDKEDKELVAEIVAGATIYELRDQNNKLLQALIPISEEMQIHIIDLGSYYYTEIIPIEYKILNDNFVINVQSSPYLDIKHSTNNTKLANQLFLIYKNSIDFKNIRKNDKIVINYTQKIRLGEPFGVPIIHYAMVEVYQSRKKKLKYYIFQNQNDGRYYDEKGKSYDKFFFKVPLRYKRISSRFTYKRWHPILHRYRAHLGVDFAAPIGRVVRASANGKIIYRGWKGGYGRVVEIRHKGGYKTLYAHLSRFSSRAKRGRYVKQGTIIGYVGTSGRSTGPHLHFGLYKHGRAINPLKRVRITKTTLTGRKRRIFLKYVKKCKKEIKYIIQNNLKPYKFAKFKSEVCTIKLKNYSTNK